MYKTVRGNSYLYICRFKFFPKLVLNQSRMINFDIINDKKEKVNFAQKYSDTTVRGTTDEYVRSTNLYYYYMPFSVLIITYTIAMVELTGAVRRSTIGSPN